MKKLRMWLVQKIFNLRLRVDECTSDAREKADLWLYEAKRAKIKWAARRYYLIIICGSCGVSKMLDFIESSLWKPNKIKGEL